MSNKIRLKVEKFDVTFKSRRGCNVCGAGDIFEFTCPKCSEVRFIDKTYASVGSSIKCVDCESEFNIIKEKVSFDKFLIKKTLQYRERVEL